MDEYFVLNMEDKENEESRRLSLPGQKSKSSTPLMRLSDPSDSQRSPRSSVLKDLINILPRHRNRVVPYAIKSGGGSGFSPNACASSPNPVTTVVTTPSAPANTVCKSDEQETNVEFARELVVQVVENIPAERKQLTPETRKDIDFVDKLDKEDCSSVASLERSESSFFSLPGTDHNTSLPDLLQPEAVYKKHADTDTDTAEYESAAETDLDSPLNAILNGSQSFLSGLIEFETPEETKIIDEGVKNENSGPDFVRSENTVVHSSVTSELKNSGSQQTDDTVCVSAGLKSCDELTAYPLLEEKDTSEEIEKKDNTCFETNNLNEVSPCAIADQVVSNDSIVVCEVSINSVDETVVNVTHTNLLTAESQVSESVSAVNHSSESEVTEVPETFDTTEKLSQLQEPREYAPELHNTNFECLVSPTVTSDLSKTVSDLCDSSTEVDTSIPVDIKNSDKEPLEVLSDNSLLKESIVESTESVIKTTVCSEKSTTVDVSSNEIVTIPQEITSDVTECPETLDTNITIKTVTPTEIGKSKTEVFVDFTEKSEEITETVFVPETELCIEALIPKYSETVEQIPELKRVFSIESDKKNDSLSDLVSNLQNLHLNDSSIVSVNHIDQHSTAEQSEEDIVTSAAPTDVLSTLSEGVTAASNQIEVTNDSLSDIVSKELTDSVCDELSQKNETINSDVPLNADCTNVTSSVVEPGFLKSATQFSCERVLSSEIPQLVEKTVENPQLPEPSVTLLEESTVVVKDNSTGSSEGPNYLHDTFISQPKSFNVEISPQETALSENVETNLISECSQVPINVNLCNSSGHFLERQEEESNIALVSVENFNNCEVNEPGVLESTCSVLSPNVQIFSINVERKKKNFGAEDISPVPLANGVVTVNNTELKLNINTSTPIPKHKQKPGLDELYEICNRQQRLLEQEDNCFLKEGPGPSIFNISGNLADLETLDAENFQDNNLSLEEIVEIEAKRLSEVFHAGSRECDSSDDENNSLSVNAPIAMESPKTLNNLNSIVSQSPGHSPPNALKSGVTRGSSPAKRGSPPLSVAADSTNFSPKLKSTPTKLQNDSNTTRNLNEQLISRKLNRDESPSKETQLNRSASPRSLSPAVQKVSSRDSLRSSPVNVNLQEADTMRKDNDFHSVDSHSNNMVSQSSPCGVTNCDVTQPNAELVNRTIQELADHNSSGRKELSYCSPTKNPALLIVEKLINSNKKTPVKIDQHSSGNVSRLNFNESNEEDENLKELLMVRELLNRQSEEYQILLVERDQEVDTLHDRLREKDERISLLNKRVNEKTEAHKQMSLILEEYEKTISRLVADKEQEQRAHEIQIEALRKEKDADKGHLEAIEIAFSDLHKKYERSKEVIEGLRKNEEVLRSSLSEYESIIRSEEQKYTTLKQHASAQLEKANVELDQMRRNHQAEISKLKAMLKKAEVNTSSLEEILKQKTKENQELTAICDELINKVGSSD